MSNHFTIVDGVSPNLLKMAMQKPFVVQRTLMQVAGKLLEISSTKVPHDIGTLQNTGNIRQISMEEVHVSYNTEYALYLHEHPELNFQKGRQGKYLEEPLLSNMTLWQTIIAQQIKIGLGI
jgi:hypothetical protein